MPGPHAGTRLRNVDMRHSQERARMRVCRSMTRLFRTPANPVPTPRPLRTPAMNPVAEVRVEQAHCVGRGQRGGRRRGALAWRFAARARPPCIITYPVRAHAPVRQYGPDRRPHDVLRPVRRQQALESTGDGIPPSPVRCFLILPVGTCALPRVRQAAAHLSGWEDAHHSQLHLRQNAVRADKLPCPGVPCTPAASRAGPSMTASTTPGARSSLCHLCSARMQAW